METWYRARFGKIEAVEVVKSTDKTVTLAGSRRNERIDSDGRWYRKTREQAKAAMVADYTNERDRAKGTVAWAEKRLADAQNA